MSPSPARWPAAPWSSAPPPGVSSAQGWNWAARTRLMYGPMPTSAMPWKPPSTVPSSTRASPAAASSASTCMPISMTPSSNRRWPWSASTAWAALTTRKPPSGRWCAPRRRTSSGARSARRWGRAPGPTWTRPPSPWTGPAAPTWRPRCSPMSITACGSWARNLSAPWWESRKCMTTPRPWH
ncbi:hypothetical protein D3C85_1122040 [compost metagenome]